MDDLVWRRGECAQIFGGANVSLRPIGIATLKAERRPYPVSTFATSDALSSACDQNVMPGRPFQRRVSAELTVVIYRVGG